MRHALGLNLTIVRRATRDFEPIGENVRAAREFIAAIVADWQTDELEWPLVQIVSELACNAVIHAKTAFTVALTEIDGGCRLGVTDMSPRRPQPRHYGTDATTGRGLRLVEQMSREWGVETSHGAKTVWVEVVATSMTDVDVDELLDGFGFDLDDELTLPQEREAGSLEATSDRQAGPSLSIRDLVAV